MNTTPLQRPDLARLTKKGRGQKDVLVLGVRSQESGVRSQESGGVEMMAVPTPFPP